MEGHIWIESEGLGKGSTVIFIVKLALPEHVNDIDRQTTPAVQPSHLRTDFSGVRVLVTDDNGYVIFTIQWLLLKFVNFMRNRLRRASFIME